MSGETSSIESGASYRLPSDGALRSAAKISCSEDKPIMLDYWTLSLDGKIIIGVKESGEKMLVKSAEEYTSMIQKIYKVESEYLVCTENSLYLVDTACPTKRIS